MPTDRPKRGLVLLVAAVLLICTAILVPLVIFEAGGYRFVLDKSGYWHLVGPPIGIKGRVCYGSPPADSSKPCEALRGFFVIEQDGREVARFSTTDNAGGFAVRLPRGAYTILAVEPSAIRGRSQTVEAGRMDRKSNTLWFEPIVP